MTDIYQEKRTKLAGELARAIKSTDNSLKTANIVIGTFNTYFLKNNTYSLPLSGFIKEVAKSEALQYYPCRDEEILRGTNDQAKQVVEELTKGKYVFFSDWVTEPKIFPTAKFRQSLLDCLDSE